MTNELTNEAPAAPQIVIQNNTWTLLKHAAGTVNKAAGKVDAKVYGPIVKQGTVQLPPQRPQPIPQEHASFFTIVGYVVVGIFVVACAFGAFILWCKGDLKGRDLIGF
jgi:hypothetical protein